MGVTTTAFKEIYAMKREQVHASKTVYGSQEVLRIERIPFSRRDKELLRAHPFAPFHPQIHRAEACDLDLCADARLETTFRGLRN